MQGCRIIELTNSKISLEVQNTYNLEEQIDLYIQENEIQEEMADYIKDTVFGIKENLTDIEEIIKKCITEQTNVL